MPTQKSGSDLKDMILYDMRQLLTMKLNPSYIDFIFLTNNKILKKRQAIDTKILKFKVHSSSKMRPHVTGTNYNFLYKINVRKIKKY